jgi:hypothetical protein
VRKVSWVKTRNFRKVKSNRKQKARQNVDLNIKKIFTLNFFLYICILKHPSKREYRCTCVWSFTSIYICVCVCVCGACVYIHTYMHTYIHTHIHTYMHTYIHTYIHTYMHAYIHTYICVCMFVCVFVCMYAHVCVCVVCVYSPSYPFFPYQWKWKVFWAVQS